MWIPCIDIFLFLIVTRPLLNITLNCVKSHLINPRLFVSLCNVLWRKAKLRWFESWEINKFFLRRRSLIFHRDVQARMFFEFAIHKAYTHFKVLFVIMLSHKLCAAKRITSTTLTNYLLPDILLPILLRDLLLLLLLLLLPRPLTLLRLPLVGLLDLRPRLLRLRRLLRCSCTCKSSSLAGVSRSLERARSHVLILFFRESLFIRSEDTRRTLYMGSEGIRYPDSTPKSNAFLMYFLAFLAPVRKNLWNLAEVEESYFQRKFHVSCLFLFFRLQFLSHFIIL